jgi:tetratricopeptide (TPR) repeat protein
MNARITLFLILLFAMTAVSSPPPPVYGVVTIVRNEAHVLKRMLDSVSRVVSYVCICDNSPFRETTKDDSTYQVAMEWISNHPGVIGEVHRDEWVNFAYNRNQCLIRARRQLAGAGHSEDGFLLLMDADFELVLVNKTRFISERPPAVLNMITYEGGLTDYRQPLLIASNWDCGYKLVTHEYLLCVSNVENYLLLMTKADHTSEERRLIESSVDPTASVARYDGIRIKHHHDGSNRKEKFSRDIALLQNHIREYDATDERAWFYLARSLEDSGDPTRAFNAYMRRIILGGTFAEELWYSTMRLGSCLISNGTDIEIAARYFVDAFNFRPHRREPLYYLTRGYRVREKYSACKLYGYHALTVPLDLAVRTDDLFINVPVYEWYIHDELAVCLSQLGEYDQAIHLLSFVVNADPSLKTLDRDNKERMALNLARLRNKTAVSSSSE